MPNDPPLRLSQGHLTLLATCPRKFQHIVLDQLGTPSAIAEQERLLQGARFHRLLQQWWLNLPIEPLLQEDQQLQQWFDGFQQVIPQIVDPQATQTPECDRLLEFAGYCLTVRYDLLSTNHHAAKILDWKTYSQPQTASWLKHHWQTRLYPFVLAETSSYLPEQIAIVYWFFSTQATPPQTLPLPYNRHQHEDTRQALTQLLGQLTTWLQRYQAGEALPQVGWGSETCAVCSFAARCGRSIAPSSSAESPEERPYFRDRLPTHLPPLAAIEEIPL